jgi:hypothetical protein
MSLRREKGVILEYKPDGAPLQDKPLAAPDPRDADLIATLSGRVRELEAQIEEEGAKAPAAPEINGTAVEFPPVDVYRDENVAESAMLNPKGEPIELLAFDLDGILEPTLPERYLVAGVPCEAYKIIAKECRGLPLRPAADWRVHALQLRLNAPQPVLRRCIEHTQIVVEEKEGTAARLRARTIRIRWVCRAVHHARHIIEKLHHRVKMIHSQLGH